MNSVRKNLDIIFEKSLKWRLLKRSFTSVEGVKVLINNFRIFDLANTGKVNKEHWISALYDSGLTIGISKEELSQLFDKYKEENTDMCDYKKFALDIFFKHKNNISLNKSNNNSNSNINYNQKETIENQGIYNNNAFLNINKKLSNSQSQKYLNINNYNLNSSTPSINTKIYNKYNLSNSISSSNIKQNMNNNFNNIRYNILNRRYNNSLDNVVENINYNGPHINMLNSTINYFRNKININNGLTYYRFILELKSKCSDDNNILKSYLPLALQTVGVFYTQNELQNLFDALGCAEITSNYFSLSKIIELIKGEMSDYRKNLVKTAYNNITNNNDNITINSLKKIFSPYKHPDFLNKRMDIKDIYNQFCETLDIFAKINNISNTINLEQFIEFYSGISPSIYDDRYFSEIINNEWSNNGTISSNNNILSNKTISNTPKINYSNLDINNFNINYEQNGKSNIIENNYSNFGNNFSIRDRVNNSSNSNIKVNLPLFYYNKNNNNTENKSTNFIENNSYQNINNSIFTPKSNRKFQLYNENYGRKDLYSNNFKTISDVNSPSKNRISDNLINQDLNLISSSQNKSNNSIDITPIINKLKEIFIINGLKSVFHFQRMLYVYDINHNGQISLNNLQTIIHEYNYNFSNEEIKNLFQFFDKENTGYIDYSKLFNQIIGSLTPIRLTLVKTLFDEFPKDNNGCINIDIMKNCFCPNKHNDVINGNKTIEEIYGEFLEYLEIFREYNNNLKGGFGKNELTYDEFCDFFGEISLEIQNDYLFSNFIQNCWKF